jgi:hypothetical protein
VPGVHVKIALEPHPSLRLAMGGSGLTSVGAQGLLWLDYPTVELLMQPAMIKPATKTCTRILNSSQKIPVWGSAILYLR